MNFFGFMNPTPQPPVQQAPSSNNSRRNLNVNQQQTYQVNQSQQSQQNSHLNQRNQSQQQNNQQVIGYFGNNSSSPEEEDISQEEEMIEQQAVVQINQNKNKNKNKPILNVITNTLGITNTKPVIEMNISNSTKRHYFIGYVFNQKEVIDSLMMVQRQLIKDYKLRDYYLNFNNKFMSRFVI
jgi:hypothetical protein